MADTKISAMTAATSLAGSEVLPVVQSGVNKGAAVSLFNAGALIYLDADYALTNTTSQQKLFNTTTNGTLTISETGLYKWELHALISAMSGTSGNADFDILGAGTATLANPLMSIISRDATVGTLGTLGGGVAQIYATSGGVASPTTATGLHVTLFGIFKVTATGTIIPSITLATGANAIAEAGSHFRIQKVAPASVFSVGAWS